MERHVKLKHSTQAAMLLDKLLLDSSPITHARNISPILDEGLNEVSVYRKMTDELILKYNEFQQRAKVQPQALHGYVRGRVPNYPYYNPYPPVLEHNISDSRPIGGFKAMICETCLITITIPIIMHENSDKIKLEHTCDPKRIIEVEHLDKKQYLSTLHEQLPQRFLASYKARVTGTIYLTAVRIPNGFTTNGTIDLANMRKDHWAVKAIIECKIIPSDNELLDFLRMVDSQSPSILNIYNSSCTAPSSHYLFAIYNKPLLV